MQIILQTLDEIINEDGNKYYQVDHSKDEMISKVNSNSNIMSAISKGKKKKKELSPNQKVRVLLYRNDELDKIRTACEVIEIA
jgi:hypothetical protein